MAADLAAEVAELRTKLGVATSAIDRLAAVDDPLAEVLRLHERLAIVTEDRKLRTLERDRLVDTLTALRAELDSLEATQAATDRRLLEAEAERDQARAAEERFRAGLAADGFTAVVTDEWLTLLAEVEGLRAAALPEGGWQYGIRNVWDDDSEVAWHPEWTEESARRHVVPLRNRTLVRRHVGPPETVDETEATGG